MNTRIGRPPWVPPVDLAREYPSLSLSALARKYDVSRETVKAALRRADITLRPLAEALGAIQWSDAECIAIQSMYLDDKRSISDISIIFGVGYKAIRNLLLRTNIKLRKRNTCGLRTLSEATKRKISIAHKGVPGTPLSAKAKEKLRQSQLGRKHSEATKAKMSQIRIDRGLSKGNRNPMKRPEVVKRWAKACNIKPNKAEQKLKSILDMVVPGMFRINVNAETVLDGKIPDFVGVDGQKRLIELFGDYWHEGEDPNDRINLFANLGYKTMVIWENKLNASDIEVRIVEFCTGEENAIY